MDNQLKIIAAARADGLDPSNLSPAQYRRLALKVRTAAEVVKDGSKAVSSIVRTSMGDVVPDRVANENKAKCETCPDDKYQMLEVKRKRRVGGEVKLVVVRTEPVCNACNCQGKFLNSKQRDPQGHCPLGHWDNRRVQQ